VRGSRALAALPRHPSDLEIGEAFALLEPGDFEHARGSEIGFLGVVELGEWNVTALRGDRADQEAHARDLQIVGRRGDLLVGSGGPAEHVDARAVHHDADLETLGAGRCSNGSARW